MGDGGGKSFVAQISHVPRYLRKLGQLHCRHGRAIQHVGRDFELRHVYRES